MLGRGEAAAGLPSEGGRWAGLPLHFATAPSSDSNHPPITKWLWNERVPGW